MCGFRSEEHAFELKLSVKTRYGISKSSSAMTVVLCTLGDDPSKVLESLSRADQRTERVIIYTGWATQSQRRRSTDALKLVKAALETMNLPYRHQEFSSESEFWSILQTVISDLAVIAPEDAIFILTGGPRAVMVPAIVSCLLLGVRAVYHPDEQIGGADPVELPLFRIRYSELLTQRQRELLRAVRDSTPKSLEELASTLERSNTTITYHTHRLRELGALTFALNPRNRQLRVPKLRVASEAMLMAEDVLEERGAVPSGVGNRQNQA